MSDTSPYWLVYGWTAFLDNFWYLIVFWMGAIVGSFLGVVIYRLPLIVMSDPRPKDFTLSKPDSFCPRCNHKLSWWENTPIFGFLFLRGRCFDCRGAIPWRDFAMEILTASVWTALFHRYNEGHLVSWINFIAMALFASLLIAAVFIDLDHFIVPDEMNWWGIAFGVGRDLLCLAAAAFLLNDQFMRGNMLIKQETFDRFTYFGWLPRSIPGGLLYASVLYTVALLGFLYYARVPWETTGNALKRFFTFEDAPEPNEEWRERIAAEEAAYAAEHGNEEEEEEQPVRLRFSPGFITILSALFLGFVVGWWSVLAVVLPLLAFVALTRPAGESVGQAVRRFFRADDLPYSELEGQNPTDLSPQRPAEAGTIGGGGSASPVSSPGSPPLTIAETQAEADQFAREAETGAHGGMGLGDVKLALAIGAILGPFPAMLSLFFATFIGAVTGITLKQIHRKQNLRYGLPFVPFMAAGALIVMLYGQQLVNWYTGLLPEVARPGATRKAEPQGGPGRRPPVARPTPDPLAPYQQ